MSKSDSPKWFARGVVVHLEAPGSLPSFDVFATAERVGDASLIATRLNAHPALVAACEYALDMLRQQFPDGKGGTETMSMKLAGAGGACAESMLAAALKLAKGV